MYFNRVISNPSGKPHLNWYGQLELLKSRGLVVEDENLALRTLKSENYYRFRGYFIPFLEGQDGDSSSEAFRNGVTFEDIVRVVQFDQRLRTLVFEATTQFELRLRSAIAYFGGAHDPHFHLSGNGLHPDFIAGREDGTSRHSDWLREYDAKMLRSASEPFVKWHQRNYSGRLPIWAAAEILDFGSLSRLLGGMSQSLSSQVAEFFGCGSSNFKSWVASLNELRNHAAHQTRLWNRSFPRTIRSRKLQLPEPLGHLASLDQPSLHLLYPRIAILAWFDSDDHLDIGFRMRLIKILGNFPVNSLFGTEQMGFPAEWRSLDIWTP